MLKPGLQTLAQQFPEQVGQMARQGAAGNQQGPYRLRRRA